MSSVAILGCGPAGLLAAHAATICGHSVTIFSKKQKSPMEGAQYMHVEIPDIDLHEPEIIKYVLIGTVDQYREKVYGSGDPDIVVSPAQYLGDHKCWDLRHTYDLLWERWRPRITNMAISQSALEHITNMNDFVISTIPAPALCQHDAHNFDYQPVWIDNLWSGPLPAEAPELWESGHVVICNGYEPDEADFGRTGWYRTANIYGHMNTEWSHAAYVPEGRANGGGQLWRVRKPLESDCDCWPMIVRAGRYGLWRKGVLTHHVFEQVIKLLS